jgi:hypothetical protein
MVTGNVIFFCESPKDKIFDQKCYLALTLILCIFETAKRTNMEITVDLGYEQLLDAIKKLPAGKIKQLKTVLNDEFIQDKASKELSDFQSLLLRAPIMTAKQFDQHKADRKHFSAWRTK